MRQTHDNLATMSIHAHVTLCAVLCATLLACTDPASPPGGPDARRIVFVARTEVPGGDVGDPGIYSVRSDGSGLRRLTLGAGHAISPAWARDGTRIAFTSSINGGTELWLMNPDGSDAHEASSSFPDCGYDYTQLSWDATGRYIAAECANLAIVFDLQTSGHYSLTERIGQSVYAPDWSPAEPLLLFGGSLDGFGAEDVLVTNPETWAPTLALESAGDAAWSPDGRSIAFIAPVNGRTAIHVANRDGTGRRAITVPETTGWGDEGPAWSPDGRWITFHRTSTLCDDVGAPPQEICIPHWSIHIVRADGTGRRQLTPDSLQATRPTW